MQVIIHCGAHATEEDLLLKTLLKNAGPLAEKGTAIPGPAKYRSLLKECMEAMKCSSASEEAPDVLWDAILDESQSDRVVLSNPHFFGSPRHSLGGGNFYPEAGERLQALQELFPFDQLEIFMALRNPATFLPALFAKSNPTTIRRALKECNLLQMHWSALLQRMRQAVPGMPVTVWCYEDLPLVWEQVLRDMGGVDPDLPLKGTLDLLATILQPEGLNRLSAYLDEHSDMAEIHKRRVLAAFLEKFACEGALEEVLDFPGWTEALIEEMSEAYEEDIFAVQRIPGVSLISP